MPDTLLSDEALRALNARLEPAHPREIVRWALEESGLREIALASAFQAEGTCVMHMATQIRPDVPVLFLETGFHFEETLAFKRRLTELLDLNVVELAGAYTPDDAARGLRSPPVRARTRAVLRHQQGASRCSRRFAAARRGSPRSDATRPRPGPRRRSSTGTSSNRAAGSSR